MTERAGVVLVGEGPSRTGGREPFRGRCGAFLESVAGWEPGQLHERWRCVNVFDRWPGRSGPRGSRFDVKRARIRVELLERRSEAWRPATPIWLLTGHRVAAAFEVPGEFPYLEPVWLPPHRTGFVIPHPSGINRWWNDASNREQFREFVNDLESIWIPNASGGR